MPTFLVDKSSKRLLRTHMDDNTFYSPPEQHQEDFLINSERDRKLFAHSGNLQLYNDFLRHFSPNLD